MTGGAALPAGGEMAVDLMVSGGRVARVTIRSRRTLGATAILTGRPVDEALALIPRLYAVCGTAQAVAGIKAAEAALGVAPAPAQQAARALLVRAEAVMEEARLILVHWPILWGEAPAAEPVRAVIKALGGLDRLLFPDGDWRRVGGGRLAPDRIAVKAAIDAAEAALALVGLAAPDEDFIAWLGRSGPASHLLRRVLDEGLAGFGAGPLKALPDLGRDWYEPRLGGADAADFVAAPDLNGEARETGTLCRRLSHPVVAAPIVAHGAGLLARMAAHMVDLAAAPAELQDHAAHLTEADGAAPAAAGSGAGIGMVEAARGRLVHRAALVDGKVGDWRVLAPTEWTFHPQGALAHGLTKVAADSLALVRRGAEMLVAACDPCVRCRVNVEGA